MIDIFKSQIENQQFSHSYLLVSKDKGLINNNIEMMVSKLKISSADRFTVDEDGSIKIADIRKLHKWISLKPYDSEYKLAIINNAELLTIESANALLKILEETPSQSIIILTTYNKSKIIATIISRCRIINFSSNCDMLGDNLDEITNEINNISNMSVSEKFRFVDGLIKNDDPIMIMNKLTRWLYYFKNRMLLDNGFCKIIKEIQKSQKLLQSTNVNKKLLLENLILII